jgi:uncharacterized protein YkwD
MRPNNRFLLGLVAGVVLVPQLFAAPAVAIAQPRVSISSSTSSVTVGDAVVIRGTVTLRSAGVAVQLQRKAGGAWKVIQTTRVRKNGTYSFKVRPAAGANVYRARTVRTRQLRSAVSRAITVRGTAPAGQQPPSLNAVQQLIFDQTNQERTSRGLPALVYSEGVEGVAQPWAEHMAATGQLDHNPAYGEQMPGGWAAAAENIASGYKPNAVVAGWMSSEGHRANILGDYTHIGIGYAVDSGGTPYYVQNFGAY